MADGGVFPQEAAVALPSVYLDTSVPSYLTRRRTGWGPASRNQLITCLWWNVYRAHFSIFVSKHVASEASRGNDEEVRKRMDVISTLTMLPTRGETERLVDDILLATRLPPHVRADAEHIAIAATHGMDYLITWNCKHLANPSITPRVVRACEQAGARCPDICTPEALLRRVVYTPSLSK